MLVVKFSNQTKEENNDKTIHKCNFHGCDFVELSNFIS